MYTTCCLMVMYPCAKFVMPMSKSKDYLAKTQFQFENINFDIEVKNQGYIEVMNICNTSSHGDTIMCQIC